MNFRFILGSIVFVLIMCAASPSMGKNQSKMKLFFERTVVRFNSRQFHQEIWNFFGDFFIFLANIFGYY